MPYVWNVAQARYRDTATGRFVSRAVVLALTEQSMATSSDAMQLLGAQVASSQLSANDFGDLFRKEIQGEFIRQYLAGRGGVGVMTQSDWGRLGRMLRDQYEYARGFQSELSGLSEAQILQRAHLYSQAAGAAYHTGQKVSMLAAGMTKVLWVLGDAEHCDDCEQLASQGWMPIEELATVPRAGATACMVNCQCGLKYQ